MELDWGTIWAAALQVFPWLALCAATAFNTLRIRQAYRWATRYQRSLTPRLWRMEESIAALELLAKREARLDLAEGESPDAAVSPTGLCAVDDGGSWKIIDRDTGRDLTRIILSGLAPTLRLNHPATYNARDWRETDGVAPILVRDWKNGTNPSVSGIFDQSGKLSDDLAGLNYLKPTIWDRVEKMPV